MALIVTDDLLESLTCSACHKFLSVQPVKVYRNKKIRCGRCSEDGDAGAVSLYNLIADQCFFECINRYDGCRKLMNSSEVREHESECVGRSYLCPICSDSTMVPTFLMIPHFKEQHKSMILDIPYFRIDLNEALSISKYYLYKHQDRLFIVIFKTDATTNYITMSAMLLGDPEEARNISQKFTLCAGTNFEIHREKKSCAVFDLSNMFGLEIEKSEISKYQGKTHVSFKIDVNTDGLVNLPIKSQSLNSEQTNGNHGNDFMLRHIYLNESFQANYPEYSVSSTHTSLIKKTKGTEFEIFLYCPNCYLMNYCISESKENSIFIVEKNKKYHLKCYYCPKLEEISDDANDLLNATAFKQILFFCFWKCGKYFNIDSLNDHEMNCLLQPSRRCPVKYCRNKNKLFDIKQHIIKDHSMNVSFQSRNKPIYISLSIEKSPMKKFVVVAHKFILLKLSWIQPKWIISIHKCNSNEEHDDGLTAVARLFDESNTFLHCLKQNEKIELPRMETLKIKCYFETNNSS